MIMRKSVIYIVLQKVAVSGKDIFTAPVFRSKPEIDLGFLHGGYWKYNAKVSNILPPSEDIMDDETEEKRTIQDDIFVAGQDFAAGLVRMEILPRLRYILEVSMFVPNIISHLSSYCIGESMKPSIDYNWFLVQDV